MEVQKLVEDHLPLADLIALEYDSEGRPAKITDATGTREFAYDLRGQVIKETVTLLTNPDSPPIRYEIRRSYTALGQPESVHLVSAEGEALSLDHKVDYSWNPQNQITSVKSLAGEFVYEYDAKNPALLTKMTGPVHQVETTYEPHRNLITGVTNRRKVAKVAAVAKVAKVAASVSLAEGASISSYAYKNDILGRREAISQGGEAFALLQLGDTNVEVAYNDRSEVVGATYRAGNETRQQFRYDYDGIGNRKEARSTVDGQRSTVSYKTNALNQYEAISENQRQSAVRPTHDLDGNLVDDDKNRYTWDSENRLIRVEAKTGDLRIEYVYDHQSRRTVRVETTNPGRESEERKTTYFLYDGWSLLAEYSRGTGGWIDEAPASPEGSESRAGDGDQLEKMKHKVRYLTWGRDLSGSLQGAGGVGGLLAIRNGDEHRFPAYDANGNISQMLDENGETVAAYAYDPFGNATKMAGAEAAENPLRFSTKPVEVGTGWLYYGFRWLDTETGRWVSRDPIEESGGVNLYGFVGNDGVNRSDVLGMHPIDDCSAAYSSCISGCPTNSDPAMMVLGQICADRCLGDLTRCRINAVGDDFSPLPSNSPECCKYKKSDEYANTNAKCFCKCAGDGDWSNYVRGCLRKAYEGGANPHNAHMACYAAASAKGYDRPEAILTKCLIKCWDYNPFN